MSNPESKSGACEEAKASDLTFKDQKQTSPLSPSNSLHLEIASQSHFEFEIDFEKEN